MGCSLFFCCFKNQNPICVAITSLIASVISFGFFIWIIVDIHIGYDGLQILYIISFGILCHAIIYDVFLLVLLCLKNNTCIIVGKLISIVIIVITFLTFILLLISWPLLLEDYVNDEKRLEEKIYSKSDWAKAIIPEIIILILLVLKALCNNYLYYVFSDSKKIDLYFPKIPQSIVSNTFQNSIQPNLFPNDKGPINIVDIRQKSDINLNNN